MRERREGRRGARRVGIVLAIAAIGAGLGGLAASFLTGIDWAPAAVLVAGIPLALLPLTLVAGVGTTVTYRVKPAGRISHVLLVGTLLLAGGAAYSFVAHSGVTDAALPRHPGQLRLLSWNTDQDAVAADDIARVVDESRPDIIVFPERFGQLGSQLSGVLRSSTYSGPYYWNGAASSVWVRSALGRYRVDTKGVPPWAGFALNPTDPTSRSPRLLIAHLEHATLTSTAVWAEQLAWLERSCTGANVIAVGDFNAVRANFPPGGIGTCRDVGETLGVTAATWPAQLPAGVGMQLDHVFVGTGWRGTSFSVLADGDGSDHRPIVVDLARSPSG